MDFFLGVLDISNLYKLFVVIEVILDFCDEVEKLWIEYVGLIVKDIIGVIVVNIFFLFSYLYKSISKKFYSLMRECCNYLVGDKFCYVI